MGGGVAGSHGIDDTLEKISNKVVIASSTFVLRYWGNPWRTSIRIAGVPVWIRTDHIWNASPKRYRYDIWLCVYSVILRFPWASSTTHFMWTRDSVVGIATGRLKGRSSSPGKVNNFLFSTSSRSALGSIEHPIQWVQGDLSPGVKRQRREPDHSPPTSAAVKKMWIYTSTPPYAFMA
jgi:hypothetical protein